MVPSLYLLASVRDWTASALLGESFNCLWKMAPAATYCPISDVGNLLLDIGRGSCSLAVESCLRLPPQPASATCQYLTWQLDQLAFPWSLVGVRARLHAGRCILAVACYDALAALRCCCCFL